MAVESQRSWLPIGPPSWEASSNARRGPRRSPRGIEFWPPPPCFSPRTVLLEPASTLIDASGVAKATFYRHFPSKGALIVAWLQQPQTRWFDRVGALAEARSATPDQVVPRFFEAVAEWLEADDFVGCPYLNSAVEIGDLAHPAGHVIRDTLAEIGGYLRGVVAAAGHRDSVRLGKELHALLAGSIALGAANRTSSHALAARDAAARLLAPM